MSKESTLILGPASKIQADDPFFALLCEFKRALKEAKVCVVLGYGYRDEHVTTMLEEALEAGLVILDVNPLEDRSGRYHDREYHHLKNTTKDALDDGSLKTELEKILLGHNS